MARLAHLTAMSLCGLAAVACIEATDVGSAVTKKRVEGLIPVDSCETLETKLRARTQAQVDEIVNYYELWARAECSPQSDGVPSDGGFNSSTNTVIEGVDEADRVESDGRYLYNLNDRGLFIFKVTPEPLFVSFVDAETLGGTPLSMFLKDDRLLIYSSGEVVTETSTATFVHPDADTKEAPTIHPPRQDPECLTGYACPHSGDGRKLQLVILDVSDRERPKVIRHVELNGSLIAARRVDGAVHTVVAFPPPPVPGVILWPPDVPPCGTELSDKQIGDRFAALRASNLAALNKATLVDFLPAMTERMMRADGTLSEGTALLAACDSAFFNEVDDGRGFTGIVSLDIKGDGLLTSRLIIGRAGEIFSTADTLYVTAPIWPEANKDWPETLAPKKSTAIHRFALRQGSEAFVGTFPVCEYQGSGVLPGDVLGPFAFHARGDELVVATSSGYENLTDSPMLDEWSQAGVEDVMWVDPNDPSQASARFTALKLGLSGLEEASRLEAVSPGLGIQAIRFVGDYAYLAHGPGKPLRAIDLQGMSEGGEVSLEGALFYLHPIDKKRLLAVSVVTPIVPTDAGAAEGERGEGASDGDGVPGEDPPDDVVQPAQSQLKVQLIDLSTPARPSQGPSVMIEGESELAMTHLAFAQSGDQLAFPVQTCAGDQSFDGLAVLSASDGLQYELMGAERALSECHEPGIRRPVFIDGWTYGLGAYRVDAAPLTDLDARNFIDVP